MIHSSVFARAFTREPGIQLAKRAKSITFGKTQTEMFSFFKKKPVLLEVPDWAPFFTREEYTAFVGAIGKYFKGKNLSYEVHDGVVELGPNEFEFGKLGLGNLSQVCKQSRNLSEYPEIVAQHFDSLIQGQVFNIEFQKLVNDYAKVKQYLGVRMYPMDYIDHIGMKGVMGKPFAGDIYAMLVFDLPHSVQNVQPEQAAKWGKSFEELFETGLQNIKRNCPVSLKQLNLGEFDIWFAEGVHFFVPNIAFDLPLRPDLVGKYGALVGLPHRHAAIIYPIETLDVIKAVNTLIPIVKGMNEEGPGSLSDNIFFFQNGEFEALPYKITEEKLQFFPTDNFITLLNSLAES